MKNISTADFLIVGGGIVGLTIAIELRRRYCDCSVVLLEKEPLCGLHASGRNSGVLHAGFYYTADSLKARFSRDGCRLLTEYCEARRLDIERCGKLVVATDDTEHQGLDELLRRGDRNGVELVEVSEAEARRIEPRARTAGRALYSPTTATVDPRQVIESLVVDALEEGVSVRTGEDFLYIGSDGVANTSRSEYRVGYLVNAAGLHADRIAHQQGMGQHYRILPFRGRYLTSKRADSKLRVHIYPVPRLDYPFLGVHFTRGLGGTTKIGPTATPGLWREHYKGLEGFRSREVLQMLGLEARVLAGDLAGFGSLAKAQFLKLRKRHLVASASRLLTDEEDCRNWRWGPTGVRAQLVDTRTRRLEMDFVVEGDDRSFHILNAVSPAFTCAPALAPYLVDRIAGATHQASTAH